MVLVTVMTGMVGIAMTTVTVVMTGAGITEDTEIIIGKESGRGLGSEEPRPMMRQDGRGVWADACAPCPFQIALILSKFKAAGRRVK